MIQQFGDEVAEVPADPCVGDYVTGIIFDSLPPEELEAPACHAITNDHQLSIRLMGLEANIKAVIG